MNNHRIHNHAISFLPVNIEGEGGMFRMYEILPNAQFTWKTRKVEKYKRHLMTELKPDGHMGSSETDTDTDGQVCRHWCLVASE